MGFISILTLQAHTYSIVLYPTIKSIAIANLLVGLLLEYHEYAIADS
ncbi:MAG: hypothetical protein F6J86_46255 [Symploca sp. SIO1B1]|nr:hypothetical protein [Symploca sp. SIO1B1]